MSEEPTESLVGSTPFEISVLRELASLNRRFDHWEVCFSSLEEKVDARLRETRPIWENVLSQLQTVNSKLNVLGLDQLETRAEVEIIKKRLPAA